MEFRSVETRRSLKRPAEAVQLLHAFAAVVALNKLAHCVAFKDTGNFTLDLGELAARVTRTMFAAGAAASKLGEHVLLNAQLVSFQFFPGVAYRLRCTIPWTGDFDPATQMETMESLAGGRAAGLLGVTHIDARIDFEPEEVRLILGHDDDRVLALITELVPLGTSWRPAGTVQPWTRSAEAIRATSPEAVCGS